MLNDFFPIVDTCRSCEDTARQSCAMVPRWRFLRPLFSASRMQRIIDLHSKHALTPHHCEKTGDLGVVSGSSQGQVGQICCAYL